MPSIKRVPVIAANWKMYKTRAEAVQFVRELAPLIKHSVPDVYLAAPFTVLQDLASHCLSTKIVVGGQNMNQYNEGAYTGEISGWMLKDAGAKFVIIGHSERRRLYNESNDIINQKIQKAFELQLNPILCIGETADERKSGKTEIILTSQLKQNLANVSVKEMSHLIVAYEPIWAIGTQQAAMPEVAQEAHLFCRKFFTQEWGLHVSQKIRILYGGSAKPDSAKKLMEQEDVDGLLVGSASLTVDSFEKMVNYTEQI